MFETKGISDINFDLFVRMKIKADKSKCPLRERYVCLNPEAMDILNKMMTKKGKDEMINGRLAVFGWLLEEVASSTPITFVTL